MYWASKDIIWYRQAMLSHDHGWSSRELAFAYCHATFFGRLTTQETAKI